MTERIGIEVNHTDQLTDGRDLDYLLIASLENNYLHHRQQCSGCCSVELYILLFLFRISKIVYYYSLFRISTITVCKGCRII